MAQIAVKLLIHVGCKSVHALLEQHISGCQRLQAAFAAPVLLSSIDGISDKSFACAGI